MKPGRSPGSHLDARAALDYLEHHLSARRAAQVEAHLASPCPACRERLRRLAALLERMRADRPEPVPDEARQRAIESFAPRPAYAGRPRLVEAFARLVFDSWAAPLPAAVRRAVGETRRLRYALAEGSLEIEVEPEADGALTIRGRLESAEPALHRIEARVLGERLQARPDAAGAFEFERVPAGDLDLAVIGPDRVDHVPVLRP